MTCQLIWSLRDDAELRLRLRPLREHWEARGPGMLRFLEELLPWLQFPPALNVHLLPPRHGGGGRVVSPLDIEFEAVLANRYPQLPEVVRLAWLILCARHGHGNDRAEHLALVPAALEAAEYVDLASCDPSTIELALATWLARSSTESAKSLDTWWQASGRPATKNRENWLRAIAAVPH